MSFGMKMKLLKKVCLFVMICAMTFGASSLLIACANQSKTNTTIETKQVVADPEYEVKSPYTLLSNGNGLYYEEVDPSDRRSTDELPAEYTQIEYLQSSGKQWIDTGYITNSETQIEAKFFIPTNFGATNGVSTSITRVLGDGPSLYYRSLYMGNYSNSNITLRENMINEIFLSANSYILTAGGTEYVNLSFSATINYTTSLKLFLGSKDANYYVDYFTKSGFKLYSLKISEKDANTGDVTYVRDFVPCVKDNECGLFDVVEQTFYTNEDENGVFNMHNDMLGSGTENDPYQISSIQDLLVFNGFANGDEYYVVTNDIIFNDGYFERNSDGTCTYHDGGDGILYDWNAPYVYFRKFDGQNHKFKNFYSSQMGLFTFRPYNMGTTFLSIEIDVCNLNLNGYFTDENNLLNGSVAMLFTCYRKNVYMNISNCKVDGYIYFINQRNASFIGGWNTINNDGWGSLVVKDCVSSGKITSQRIAAAVGCATSATMQNCVNYADVDSGSTNGSYATGFFYSNNGGDPTMKNCKNYGKITGYVLASGLAISNGGTYRNCYNYGDVKTTRSSNPSGTTTKAGGIATGGGSLSSLSYVFYSCGNEGNVTSFGNAAGLYGTDGYYGTPGRLKVEGCYNRGTISSSKNASGLCTYVANAKNCVNYGDIKGSTSSTGLFSGFVSGLSGQSLINCINYGGVVSSQYAYGIIDHCSQNNEKLIYGCQNYGYINGSSRAAGIVSRCKDTTIRNCANFGNVKGGSNTGGIIGMVEASGTIKLENCGNFGTITGSDRTAGLVGGQGSGITLIIQNCISAGEIKSTINNPPSSYHHPICSSNISSQTIKNCIADCRVVGQQKKQFWGNDFSGFFLNRMTSKIGLSAFERVGRYMTPIPSASYLENDLNFIKMN